MAKAKIGIVTSIKMAQTAVVLVESVHQHPMYHKSIRRTKKFHIHDPLGVKVGDKVAFVQTKPISKTKKWVVSKVL